MAAQKTGTARRRRTSSASRKTSSGTTRNKRTSSAGTGRRKTAGRTGGNRNRSGRSAGKNTTRRQNPAPEVRESGINMGSEFQLIVSFCLTVLLMLSNFGLGGKAGRMLSSFFFGLFGCVQYVMPVMFFLGVALLLVNDYNSLALKKCLAGFIALMMVSAFVQLVFNDNNISIYEIFSVALEDKTTGGLIGGGFGCLLKSWFGFAGAIVIVTCIFILSLIMLTQKSVTEFFKTTVDRVKNFRADSEKRREERARNEAFRRKTAQDKVREKQCEDKVKELEEKRLESQKRTEETAEASRKDTEFRVPTFHASDEVKPKDAVKELHPEIYPFSKEDGKTDPFNKDLDFSAFSFNSDKSPEDFMKELREKALTREEMEERVKRAESMPAMGVREMEADPDAYPEEDEPVIQIDAISEEDIPDDVVSTSDDEDPGDSFIPGQAGISGSSDEIVIHKEEEKTGSESSTTGKDQNTFTVKKARKGDYVFPPISLLDKPDKSRNGDEDDYLKNTARKLQETLASFGVNVRITDISFGPTVTRYEMVPEQGIKVSKIVSLTDDIKLSLAAQDIRIEAPIPGKSAIGIEVPNKHVHTVHFRELIEHPRFRNFRSKLAFAVGKDIGGQPVISDVDKMPHLLIAGATGAGKSVCINTLIMSLIYKARPDEVKLILIDPKMVELSMYNGIPHLLIPVVTDPKKASGALNWAVAEMTDRYDRFTRNGVRNIEGYNEKVKQVLASEGTNEEKLEPMPRIVVVIDELADLMMVASGEVEDAIVRLSQLARAAGIHLVIATQRPSVNVITGLIKANIPSRIAFFVSSGVDSRTIIDMNGAEKLLGKGDMLFYPAGMSKPSRVQGAFITDKEINDVVEFLKENENVAVYDEKISESIEKGTAGSGAPQDRDEYFAEAARFLIEKDKASIGMLQRMFKIGFNRAARIMDQLAEAGIVGPEEGTKPRKILMSQEQLEAYLEEYY